MRPRHKVGPRLAFNDQTQQTGSMAPKVAIVIPTLNEASWLPRLLKCLSPFRSHSEVIVADAGSSDSTVHIAEKFGCRVVRGGLPAVARNRGAQVATASWLLFIDADAYPTIPLLKHSFAQTSAHADVICYRHVPMTDDWFTRFCYVVLDAWFSAVHRRGLSQGLTNYLLVSRDVFDSIGGFREDLAAGEDVDFVRRASTAGVTSYERDIPVLISARRFHTESALLFALKSAMWGVLRSTGSSRSVVDYRWVPHSPQVARAEESWLRFHGLLRGFERDLHTDRTRSPLDLAFSARGR